MIEVDRTLHQSSCSLQSSHCKATRRQRVVAVVPTVAQDLGPSEAVKESSNHVRSTPDIFMTYQNPMANCIPRYDSRKIWLVRMQREGLVVPWSCESLSPSLTRLPAPTKSQRFPRPATRDKRSGESRPDLTVFFSSYLILGLIAWTWESRSGATSQDRSCVTS